MNQGSGESVCLTPVENLSLEREGQYSLVEVPDDKKNRWF